MGGTALRIVYGSTRFSEDLDFDNLGLSLGEFRKLDQIIQKDLKLEGLEVATKMVTEKAYRLKIRIPKLLFESGLSPMADPKILIQVDTVPQHFPYLPQKSLLNKFDVFTQINVVPKGLFLAQKIYASVNRKRPMGRDFFDIVFLYRLGAQPNFDYLKKHIGVEDKENLKVYLLKKKTLFNFEILAQGVEPFLFAARDKKKVLLFREFMEGMG